MMSRRRSLVGVLPRGTAPFLVVLCAATMILPSLAPAKRGKSAAVSDREDRSGDTDAAAAVGDTKPASDDQAADPAAAAQPAADDVVVDSSDVPERRQPPQPAPVFGSEGDFDEHVHVRRGDTLDHILADEGHRPVGGLRLAARGAGRLRSAARSSRSAASRCASTARPTSSRSVRYEIDDHSLLDARARGPTARSSARREALPYFVEVKGVAGRIERGLKQDAAEAGRARGGRLGAGRHLRLGPRRRRRPAVPATSSASSTRTCGRPGRRAVEAGKILGAEIVTRGEPLTAVLLRGRGRARAATTARRPTRCRATSCAIRSSSREISSEFSRVALPSDPAPLASAPGRRPRRAARHAGARGRRRLGRALPAGWAASAAPCASSTSATASRDLRAPRAHRAGHPGGRAGRARSGDRLRRLDRARDRAAPPLRGRARAACTSTRWSFEARARRCRCRIRRGGVRARAARRSRASWRSLPVTRSAVGGLAVGRATLHAGVGRRATSTARGRASSRTAGASGTHPGEHARGVRGRPGRRRRAARARRARHRRRPRRRAPRRRARPHHRRRRARCARGRWPSCRRSTPATGFAGARRRHPWRGRGIAHPDPRRAARRASRTCRSTSRSSRTSPPIEDAVLAVARSPRRARARRCWRRSTRRSWRASGPRRRTS